MRLSAAAAWDSHSRDMVIALTLAAIGAAAGVVPLMMARDRFQADVAQSALIGLTLQLFGTAALALIVSLLGVRLTQPLAFWLLAFYWAVLIVLAIAYVKAVRSAPIEPAKA
jgi:hypothetical protein